MDQELPAKIFELTQITEYRIDLQVIQHPSGCWLFGLNFYPDADNGIIKDGDVVVGLGVAKKVVTDATIIYSRETYSQWEYAAESAIDAIETFGFDVEGAHHIFNVFAWSHEIGGYVTRQAEYANQEFRMLPEVNNPT